MIRVIVILVFYFSCSFSNAFSVETEQNEFNNFSLNLGGGTCLILDTQLDPDLCFHAGFDYIFSKNLDMVGFRYHKFNWNYEFTYNILGQEFKQEGDVDLSAFYLYYRLPLGKFTLAIGPGVLDNSHVSYFAPAITIGYLNNITSAWGFELAGTTFYFEKGNEFYIYLYGGLRVNF